MLERRSWSAKHASLWIGKVAAAVVVGTASTGAVLAQDRVQRSIDGPITRDAVTRSLAIVPESAGGADGPSEVSAVLRIPFRFDSAELTEQAEQDLRNVAAALNEPELAGVRFILEGHTDAVGDAEYNLRLSERRAQAVRGYLILHGVAGSRLEPAGFGEDRLQGAYAPDDKQQRRVEIVRVF